MEKLLSVGIDIGTSTTQLIFSKLTVKNTASSFNIPRVCITEKEIVYKSKIYFTPLTDSRTINCKGIKDIILKEYENADVKKEHINTGAVIITGETARKENAKEVLSTLSGFAGDFVVATAGPDLESIISGKGAGAAEYSKVNKKSVLNIDIGGGTSNFALFCKGEVADTGCMNVGGRLLKVDESGIITYVSPVLSGFFDNLSPGSKLTKQVADEISHTMTEALMQGANIKKRDRLLEHFVTNKGIAENCHIDCISFSGGVSDIVYNNKSYKPFEFGDIGINLGECIKNSALAKEYQLVKGAETIRATVVGAGSHTTEISGSTIAYCEEILPLKNMPVLKLTAEEEADFKNAVSKKLKWYEDENVAIAFSFVKEPHFAEVEDYARDIIECTKGRKNIVVVTERDVANALGQSLNSLTDKKVVCIDSVELSGGDYIDIGKPVANGIAVPVVIKTLVFN